jgi:hypothetical protein
VLEDEAKRVTITPRKARKGSAPSGTPQR